MGASRLQQRWRWIWHTFFHKPPKEVFSIFSIFHILLIVPDAASSTHEEFLKLFRLQGGNGYETENRIIGAPVFPAAVLGTRCVDHPEEVHEGLWPNGFPRDAEQAGNERS
jgi:hypothetical protein